MLMFQLKNKCINQRIAYLQKIKSLFNKAFKGLDNGGERGI